MLNYRNRMNGMELNYSRKWTISKLVTASSNRSYSSDLSLVFFAHFSPFLFSAVMPTKGWKGLTEEDNFQALAIAKVMKMFTDEGIEVQLRFAHEVNWYVSRTFPFLSIR